MSYNIKIRSFISIVMLAVAAFEMAIILTGCSYTIHERRPDNSNPTDMGSETKINLRGPKAVLQTKF